MSQSVIDQADAVIFAADLGVKDRGRFAGKPVVAGGVKRGIDDPDGMIATAIAYMDDPDAPRVEGAGEGRGSTEHRIATGDEPWGLRIRRILMTGVSYMIPFVAAGGLLIALSFLLGGYEITGPAGDIVTTNTLFNLPDLEEAGLQHALFDSPFFAYLGALFFMIGATAFKFLVPALAGYIAYAIADRPGIAPGFVMGAIAIDLGGFGIAQTGFLGGIIGGVLAGVVALWIARWKVASWMRGLMPVLVIPLAHHAHRRPRHGGRPRQAARRAHGCPQLRPHQHGRERCRHRPGHRARADDGLRHGRPAQQDRLPLRDDRPRRCGHRHRGRTAAADHGSRHARRHGAPARPRPRHRGAAEAVHRARARERQGRVGARRVVHHRGRDPVRSRRPAAGDPLDHAGQRRHGRPLHGRST